MGSEAKESGNAAAAPALPTTFVANHLGFLGLGAVSHQMKGLKQIGPRSLHPGLTHAAFHQEDLPLVKTQLYLSSKSSSIMTHPFFSDSDVVVIPEKVLVFKRRTVIIQEC